jgi:hypothetical protein
MKVAFGLEKAFRFDNSLEEFALKMLLGVSYIFDGLVTVISLGFLSSNATMCSVVWLARSRNKKMK